MEPLEEDEEIVQDIAENEDAAEEICVAEESDDSSLNGSDTVSKNLSAARLTLEELIASDNETSRQLYLSPTTSPTINGNQSLADDGSSVSSGFDSDLASLTSRSSMFAGSTGTLHKHVSFDAFQGIQDDDFGQLDRFGFLSLDSKTAKFHGDSPFNESDFLQMEKTKLEQEKEKEAERALKWLDMLKVLELEKRVNYWPKRHEKFVSRLMKGIPDCLRTRIWESLLKARGLYDEGVVEPEEVPEFSTLYLKVSGFERQIDLDIERTLRDHVLFKIRYSQAQISLFKILVAYSNLDPDVGYCQGMSTIAAFFLLYFDEKMAFEGFVRMMRRDDLRLMYKQGFPLLFEYFWIHERLLRKFLPTLWKHLESHNISTSIYATKWYLTLFLSFPTRLAARIWDLFLFYGLDILPLTAIALLKLHSKRICTMSFEQTMQFLNRMADAPNCACPDKLVGLVEQLCRKYFGVAELDNGHARGFHKYRREYQATLL